MIYSEIEIKKKFGAKIREYRKNANWTQSQLAEKCNCAWQTISGIERGDAFPSSTLLFNLSNALNVPLVAFFAFENTSVMKNDEEVRLLSTFKQISQDKQPLAIKILRTIASEN